MKTHVLNGLIGASAVLGLLLAGCAPASVPAQAELPTLAPTLVDPVDTLPVDPPTPTPRPTFTPVVEEATPTPPIESGAEDTEVIARLQPGDPVSLVSLEMVSASNGWGVAEGGYDFSLDERIIATADGGDNWRDRTPPQLTSSEYALGMAATLFALDAQRAWAVYYDKSYGPLLTPAVIWRTTDGGATWQPSAQLDLSDAAFFAPTEISFSDPLNGWVLAHVDAGMSHDYVILYGTTDGGATWTRLQEPTDSTLPQSCGKTGMVFTSAETGWITGDCQGVVPGAPYLQRTVDGGRTWAEVDLPAPQDAPEAYTGDNTACGILTPLLPDGATSFLTVRCEYFDTGNVDAFIYRTGNEGQTWFARSLPDGFEAADFVSARNGWVLAGGDGSGDGPHDIFQTFDGGQTFNLLRTLDWGGELSFVSNSTGWAIALDGDRRNLLRTTDAGRTWEQLQPEIVP